MSPSKKATVIGVEHDLADCRAGAFRHHTVHHAFALGHPGARKAHATTASALPICGQIGCPACTCFAKKSKSMPGFQYRAAINHTLMAEMQISPQAARDAQGRVRRQKNEVMSVSFRDFHGIQQRTRQKPANRFRNGENRVHSALSQGPQGDHRAGARLTAMGITSRSILTPGRRKQALMKSRRRWVTTPMLPLLAGG